MRLCSPSEPQLIFFPLCWKNLEADHVLEMNKIQTDISEMKGSHEQAMQTLETNYYGKLIVEYDKYTALDTRTTNMRDDYERYLLLPSI